VRSGFGAGTKDFPDRANALRIILAEAPSDDAMSDAGGVETLTMLAADLDDVTGEQIAATADTLRDAGALDVTLLQTLMKKGRPGVRVVQPDSIADASVSARARNCSRSTAARSRTSSTGSSSPRTRRSS
jgi:pyridinium-3,5-bisthiocarboxylic acid mononucleotide nickel chelatase